MGLQIWLPLVEDATNQGLDNRQFTNSGGVTFVNDGKLGKCAYFQGSSYLYSDNLTLGNTWTVCWWAKAAMAQSGYMISLGNAATSVQMQLAMRTHAENVGNLKYICNTGFFDVSPSVSQADYCKWNHYCLVNDGSKCQVYINGNYITEANNATYYSAHRFCVGAYYSNANFNGYINDVRLYDEALSPREIKEISKGLVLHYPLAMPGGANLGLNTGHDWAWSAGTGNYAFNRVFVNPSPIEKTTYTVSANVEVTGGSFTKVTVVPYNSGTTASQGTRSDTPIVNGKISTQVTVTGDAAEVVLLYAGVAGATAGNSVIFRNIKIEKGTVATPWIPNSSDSLYSKLGLNDSIIYDTSGYKYNGMLAGTFVYSGDSPRYQTSTQFNGTDNGILINNLQLSDIINTAVTYSFWIKPSGENGARSVYFGSYSGISWSIEKTASNIIRGYWNGSPDVNYSGATITDGIWQHVCITKNGTSDIKVYIDGVLKATSTATHSALTFPTTYRIGRDVRSNDGTPYKGLMSDFRIYATALSADDVMELYHTPITLSSNGTLLTQGEYSEV